MLRSSTVSRFCCFDFVLYYLDWLHMRLSNRGLQDIRFLKMQVRLLKIFHLHTRRKHQTYNGMFFRIKDLVYRISHDLESAYIRCQSPASDASDISCELDRIEDDMWLLFEMDIKELCIMLSDYNPVGLELEDYGRLTVDVIESLLQNLMDLLIEFSKYFGRRSPIDGLENFRDKLMFLKNLIGFATLQGVERNQLIDLLIHVEAAAINTACQICKFLFGQIDEMEDLICKLFVSKIDLVDPRFRQTCINVLTASKLARSSLHTSLLEKNSHPLAAELNEDFLSYIYGMTSQTSYTAAASPLDDYILNLLDVASVLRFLLRQHLIGVVVIDMWIAICAEFGSGGVDKETEKLVNFIMTEIYIQSPLSFPRTNELGSIDFLVESLKELAISEDNSIAFPNGHIRTVVEDLEFLKSFLRNIVEKRNHSEKLQTLWNGAMEVAYKAQLVIDCIVVGEKPDCLDIIAGDIKLMRIKAQEISDSPPSWWDASEAPRITENSNHMASPLSTPALNEVLVSLDDEVNAIIDRLRSSSEHLDIVSIVGMPGLGKTTLASKVFNDPSILFHFHILAWCCVSQVYSRKSLLVQILCSIFSENPDKYLEMNEEYLAELLYKRLKGNRYVIVLDDLWHVDAWNLLENLFPDDANGSRILVTSRSRNVPLQIKPASEPHHLRPLTDEESWKLLRRKIFGKEGCPPTLSVIGTQIAKDCKGLPLSVVIVAGILASVERDCWEEVANSLSSSTVIETENGMKTLDLSYRYLPDYLKPCLLYFGAFEEDRDIPVRRLVLLWISEGFVKSEANTLEGVADNYLMDLIDRNLVMVTKQRSVGGVKACKVHDLVREFCVAKAKEESFLQILHESGQLFPLSCVYNSHRLCLYGKLKPVLEIPRTFFPLTRCLLFFGESIYRQTDLSPILRKFKLLRVLDLEYVYFYDIHREIELLDHLRYLVISWSRESIPSSIANLSRLETFIIICSREKVKLPETIWKMKKLRYLYIEGGSFRLPIHNLEVSPVLYQLDTFGPLSIDLSSQCLQKILSRIPNIRRLIFSRGNFNGTIELMLLDRLESLKIDRLGKYEFAFPLNLKKLTLSSYFLSCSRISTIGELPNLQVLKLRYVAFEGGTWEMKEGEFLKLKFLKLENLDIVRWTTACDEFPPLRKLVLDHCWNLEEIPSCLEETSTIEMIEVSFCHESAVSLVKQIQQQQMGLGNEDLKILIREGKY